MKIKLLREIMAAYIKYIRLEWRIETTNSEIVRKEAKKIYFLHRNVTWNWKERAAAVMYLLISLARACIIVNELFPQDRLVSWQSSFSFSIKYGGMKRKNFTEMFEFACSESKSIRNRFCLWRKHNHQSISFSSIIKSPASDSIHSRIYHLLYSFFVFLAYHSLISFIFFVVFFIWMFIAYQQHSTIPFFTIYFSCILYCSFPLASIFNNHNSCL